MRQIIQTLSIFLLIGPISCSQNRMNRGPDTSIKSFEGYYVTNGYFTRAEGFDWVGVFIQGTSDSTAFLSVRSRADKKRPTCTFDSRAVLTRNHDLVIRFEDKEILISLQNEDLVISGKNEKSKNILSYFCSGGATLEGRYKKLKEPLDDTLLRYTDFEKSLSLQGITFSITSMNTGFSTGLVIEPSGLEIDNRPVRHEINGWIKGAEIEDLNSDGFPEVLVYIQTMDGGNFGSVIGYSVNNGKSMSQMYFPDLSEHPEAGKGYMGYDEFTVVETSLGRRFPIFELSDSAAVPTGRMRQIEYNLVNGENSRILKIVNITEYSTY